MARYAIIKDGIVENIAIAEAAFAAAQGWVASNTAQIGDLWNGQTFTKPPAPAPAVPPSVSMRQARRALLAVDLLDAAEAAIASIEDQARRREARVDWEFAAEVRRDSPLVQALAPTLGLTSEQVDELFIAAAAID